MIYYYFSKFQPMYYKGTLRSTIHMSHRLRRKPPELVSIVARGPWSRFGTEERTGSSFPATMLTGGDGKEGEKHEGDESNLWTCSMWVGMAGKGIPHGEQRAAPTASRGSVLRRPWAVASGPGSFTAARGCDFRGRLGLRRTGGGGSAVLQGRRPWQTAASSISVSWRPEPRSGSFSGMRRS